MPTTRVSHFGRPPWIRDSGFEAQNLCGGVPAEGVKEVVNQEDDNFSGFEFRATTRDSGFGVRGSETPGFRFRVSDFWQLPGIRVSVFEAQNLSGGVRAGFMEGVVDQEDANTTSVFEAHRLTSRLKDLLGLVTRVKKKKKIELFLRIETTRIGKIINFRSIALQGYHEQNMLKGHLPRVIYHQVY